jgi:hypothetical protein
MLDGSWEISGTSSHNFRKPAADAPAANGTVSPAAKNELQNRSHAIHMVD